VLFCPEDLSILKEGSALRRRFLDAALSQLRPNYAAAIQEYHRLYEHKSRILRDGPENPTLYEALPEFSYRMAQVGALIIRYRARYLSALDEEARRFCGAFSGGREDLRLQYQTVSTVTDPLAEQQTILAQILEHQAAHEAAERASGQCLTGPHKDDFSATLNDLSVRSYGSQGQTRTAAISLKLSERELLRRDTGEEPLLLLDDVLSELDPLRQDFVLNQLSSGQVFITCCEADKLTALGRTLRVRDGKLEA
jgi:DNA replication and repair protein RecF